jgi:hypothetical protein
MKRFAFYAVIALAVLAAGAALFKGDAVVRQWKADRTRLLEQAANAKIDQAAALNRLKAAEAALRSRDSARAHAIKARIAAARSVPVPDTCKTIVAERDAIIDEQEVVAEDLRHYINWQHDAFTAIIDSASSINDQLSALVQTAPVDRGRSGLARLLPHLSAGFGAVVGPNGSVHAGPSVQLGWEF